MVYRSLLVEVLDTLINCSPSVDPKVDKKPDEVITTVLASPQNFLRKCAIAVLSYGPMPKHIAFIMDGNRRYAKFRSIKEGTGHRVGYSALIASLIHCYEMGVKYITVYAFSIDNFKRDPSEVQSLMELMEEKINELLENRNIINKVNCKINFWGNLDLLSEPLRLAAQKLMASTAENTGLVFSVCMPYTSTSEIVNAVNKLCAEKKDMIQREHSGNCNGHAASSGGHLEISVADLDRHMYSAGCPDPDIVIRTSAAALHAVFRLWGLEEDGGAAADDPCGKRVWFESPARNASINCSCPDSANECRITHLNVTGYPNITDIQRDLFKLTELVSLDLSNNNLNGSIPPEIVNLSNLKTWHFNNNQLDGIFPAELSRLRNLQSLWLFDNHIEGLFPDFIVNSSNLTDLRMYGMKLQGPIPKTLSNLNNLKILMLGDLDGGGSFNFIADWENLSTLSLRNCGISGQFPSIAPKLPNLRYLDLSSNSLSGEIQLLLPYKNASYLYVGDNNFNGSLPSKIVQPSLALDVSYNPSLSGNLPNNPANEIWSINYIGTLIDANRTINSDNRTLLNCLRMKECNRKYYNNPITSFAVNCGGKQKINSHSLATTFYDDNSDLGAAGFHVNPDGQWVVSHVGSDPFSFSHGIVNTSQPILGTDMPELYQTARTSTSDLWYYVVGLANGRYKVQLFFAEIVIANQSTDGPGRRLFNIDIQDRNFKRDFDITKEAGGSRTSITITDELTVNNSMLKIHLYWNGRGTCCIPSEGVYGPLVSAIRVFGLEDSHNGPPPPSAPHSARQDIRRRGVVAGIAALCIAAALISSSVVYLWWKWVSLVKHPKA